MDPRLARRRSVIGCRWPASQIILGAWLIRQRDKITRLTMKLVQLPGFGDSRPRIAIVGGGGAMGRLFAQLLVGAAQEIDLIDYFGPDSKAANLQLALADVRKAGARNGSVASQTAIARIAAAADSSGRNW